MSLRYGARIPARPAARLAGWFDRRTGLWPARRWLDLHGPRLSYRHRQHSLVLWTCDLRECRVAAGCSPTEIVLHRPGQAALSLFALSLDELKVWFAEIKRVSDGVHDFYHLTAKIGHTATGPVILGRDRQTEQAVAIHAADKTQLPLPAMLRLTKRDPGVIAATQSHAHLVRVVDLFESTQRFYTVTELVSGGALEALLPDAPLPAPLARAIMRDVLAALRHLHARDIVHGHVDARHILCTRRQLPCPLKLLTYGRATARRDAHLHGGVPREPRDAAPEVVCFRRRTAASDVFAAGVLLHRLLRGCAPFESAGAGASASTSGGAGAGTGVDDHEHESEGKDEGGGGGEAAYLGCVSRGVRWEEDGAGGKGAREMVERMLVEDAGARPSADECLRMEWFQEGPEGPAVERAASDPKTVIVDFEAAQALRETRCHEEGQTETYADF